MPHPTSDNLRAVIDALAGVRDSVRLRTHLLSMESQTRWREIEAQLDAAEENLNRDARESMARMRELVESAQSFVERNLKAH